MWDEIVQIRNPALEYLREMPHVGKCERCGNTTLVERHHILPLSRGGNLLDQFKWICRPCHRWIHDNPQAAKEQGWMRSGWQEITKRKDDV